MSDRERTSVGRYRLIDFGEGRKLESFGGRLLIRPSPAAEGVAKRRSEKWGKADSVFDPNRREWEHRTKWRGDEVVEFGDFRMPVSPTPFGHVGVFPEQASNWRWLADTAPAEGSNFEVSGAQAGVSGDSDPSRPPRVNVAQQSIGLNLFGYTGASSVAMAATGMRVVHVDAAKQNVTAAKSAAMLNGLDRHPIRYLVDDAAKFVAREVRRENQYHTIIMDPPAYGHSPRGKAWRLERDLWPLIDDCLTLLSPNCCRLLITGHSPQVGPMDVVDYLETHLPVSLDLGGVNFHSIVSSGRLALKDISNRKLDAGFFVRCSFRSANA